MHTSFIPVSEPFTFRYMDSRLVVQHMRDTTSCGRALECFKITTPAQVAMVFKDQLAGSIAWSGMRDSANSFGIGHGIERKLGISLPLCPDPFTDASARAQVTSFDIDGMKVDKAVLPFTGPEVIHYRLHFYENWQPRIGRMIYPGNRGWAWYPVSIFSQDDFRYMMGMVIEYEDGTYEENRQMDDAITMLLRKLEKRIRPYEA